MPAYLAHVHVCMHQLQGMTQSTTWLFQELRREGLMKLNCTHMVMGDRRELLEKANIWEADMLLPVGALLEHACMCLSLQC